MASQKDRGDYEKRSAELKKEVESGKSISEILSERKLAAMEKLAKENS